MEPDLSTPDFSNATPIVDNAIITNEVPDFSNPQEISPPKKEVSPISGFLRSIFKNSPIEKMNTEAFKYGYIKKFGDVGLEEAVNQREQDITNEGVLRQVDAPMSLAVGGAAAIAPIKTAASLGAFAIKDHFFNARRWLDENKPDTKPALKDLAEILDFGATAGAIGKATGLFDDVATTIKNRFTDLNLPGNVDVPAETVAKVNESPNLLPEEKIDIAQTLGANDKHISTSLETGLPVNVSIESLVDLTQKPYWDRLRGDLLIPEKTSERSQQAEFDQSMHKSGESFHPLEEAMKEVGKVKPYANGKEITEHNEIPSRFKSGSGKPLDEVRQELESGFGLKYESDADLRDALKSLGSKEAKPQMAEDTKKYIQETIGSIKELQKEKKLSNITVAKLKETIGIENLKKADIPQLEKLRSFMGDLKEDDKFLSEKQVSGLKDIIKSLPNPEITPKRIVLEKFGEKEDILNEGVRSKISPELIPTVDIKQGHPLVTKIVDNARELMDQAEKEVNRRNKNFDEMLNKAEKSRKSLLTPEEQFKRSLYPTNPEIFRAMSGERIELTKEEAGVVAYLRNFFAKAKEDLKLEKYRQNYITHLEKPLTEKILSEGFLPAIRSILQEQKPTDLPVDLMLELDNIIGSEKFFKYAMERKGGLNPTQNLRRIVNSYSNLYETKMALDKILPEGQAVTQALLKGKSAVWMKRFLQNLKGRALDNQFKTGPMAWLAKTADAIVDVGYLKLLALPGGWMSALKNVVAGEANTWLYHDFQSYMVGKQRFISNPKRAYDLAKQFGLLDGTYTDYAQKGIGSLKKIQDLSMSGQRIGEIEVRSSIMTSMMTDKEWESGKISPERVNEMKDVIAMTQGVFSKVDSPLLLQTWYGRMFFQMNRWRITNALLMRKVVGDAAEDIKAGNYKTPAVTRLGKMVVAYGVGMYVANELYKAGYQKAGDVARNMAQTIDGVTTLFTDGDLAKMFTDNPTLHLFKEFSNTIQDLSVYLHVPGSKESKDPGIEDTYIAPVEGTKDVLATLEQ